MEVIFYSEFSKRKNSTKNPTSAGAISVSVTKQVTLKGQCDLLRPSFFVSDVTGFVYCKAWNTYYYIRKIAYDINGAQYIECEVDFLGTWRDVIKATPAYIQYSSSSYDANLPDNRVAQDVTKSYVDVEEDTLFVGGHNAGCFCLTTSCIKYGATAWIVDETNMRDLIDSLCSGGSSIWQSLEELFGDAVGSITGLRYMPIAYSNFPSEDQDEIALGDYNTGYQGIVSDGFIADQVTVSIPWIYSDFRRSSDYTKFVLVLPFVGPIEISADNLIGHDSLTIYYTVSMTTGVVVYGVWADDKEIGYYNGTAGRQIPMATDQVNAMGFLGGMITAGVGAYGGMAKNLAAPLALGGYGGGALAAGTVIGGIAAATIAANKHDFVTIGGYDGGFSECVFNKIVLYTQANVSRTDPAELTALYGRPCMKVMSLSNLTGYVQTVGFSIDVNALDEVKEMINNAMDSGVYLE